MATRYSSEQWAAWMAEQRESMRSVRDLSET